VCASPCSALVLRFLAKKLACRDGDTDLRGNAGGLARRVVVMVKRQSISPGAGLVVCAIGPGTADIGYAPQKPPSREDAGASKLC